MTGKIYWGMRHWPRAYWNLWLKRIDPGVWPWLLLLNGIWVVILLSLTLWPYNLLTSAGISIPNPILAVMAIFGVGLSYFVLFGLSYYCQMRGWF